MKKKDTGYYYILEVYIGSERSKHRIERETVTFGNEIAKTIPLC